ncbi:MAG: phage major capsid protein, P2 family [Sphingomonadaceae bacterium]|nr:phage major capsid protein, P2 family [Sphingomonadaceae bacterium]
MRPETRAAMNAFTAQVARLNGVEDASQKFTVSPTIQQRVETLIQESSAFLKQVNIVPVTEQSGEVLGIGVGGPIASRTNTAVQDRVPADPSSLTSLHIYQCVQTNFDTAIKYAKLDMWAKFPDFQARIRNSIIQRQALDRMMIGFRGTTAAPVATTTDLVAHPNLEDVNIGWLQHIRNEAPARNMTGGHTAGTIKVGTTAGDDYRSLDALVYDGIQLLDPWFREDPGLVAVVGRGLLHDKYFGLINDPANDQAIDKVALQALMAEKKLGGLPVLIGPYMPPQSILITRPDNLSIYYQTGGRRRTLFDNVKRDQYENFESSNDAYVVEQYPLCALLENITLV